VAVEGLPIETRSLLIRHLVPEDIASLFDLSHETAYRTWLPSQVFRDRDHADSVLDFLISQYLTPGHPGLGPYVLAVEHRGSGTLLGHVGFSPLDGDIEIGFAIAQAHQGQGYATEAIVAATRWALQAFELESILGITSAANVASKKTLLRAGFAHQREQTMDFQGTEQDVSVYALVRNSTRESEA